jgi:hypothetical protein
MIVSNAPPHLSLSAVSKTFDPLRGQKAAHALAPDRRLRRGEVR